MSPTKPRAPVDLYAGAGGWDLGARQLGLDPMGYELNPDACATRAAAGLTTIRADVLEVDPHPAAGVIASLAAQLLEHLVGTHAEEPAP